MIKVDFTHFFACQIQKKQILVLKDLWIGLNLLHYVFRLIIIASFCQLFAVGLTQTPTTVFHSTFLSFFLRRAVWDHTTRCWVGSWASRLCGVHYLEFAKGLRHSDGADFFVVAVSVFLCVFLGMVKILGFCWLVNGGRGDFVWMLGFWFLFMVFFSRDFWQTKTQTPCGIVVFGRCFKGAFLKSWIFSDALLMTLTKWTTKQMEKRVPKDTMLGGADGVTLSGGQAWIFEDTNFTLKIHPQKLAWTLNMISFQ